MLALSVPPFLCEPTGLLCPSSAQLRSHTLPLSYPTFPLLRESSVSGEHTEKSPEWQLVVEQVRVVSGLPTQETRELRTQYRKIQIVLPAL